MLIKIISAICAALVLVALYAVLRVPKVYRISRSITIKARPDAIFPYLNNPKLIQEWNPFRTADATLQTVFSGPSEGVGAAYAWEGAKVGAGKATIVEVQPNKRVGIRLEFVKPFPADNRAEYRLAEKGESTELTWTIDETATVPRYLSLFINLDQMVGKEFDKGLNMLKVILEPKAP